MNINQDNLENSKQDTSNDVPEGELRPGFKFRLVMTLVFFILAAVYVIWLLKII